MQTDMITGLRTVEEVMEATVPDYNAFLTLLSNTQEYNEKIENMDFTTLTGNEEEMLKQMDKALISGATSEVEHIKASAKTSTFKKHFYLTKYTESELDPYTAINNINRKAVRVGLIKMDQDTWKGKRNDGFFNSSSTDYIENANAEIAKNADFSVWNKKIAEIVEQVKDNNSSSRIYLGLYGDTSAELAGRTIDTTGSTFLAKLRENNPDVQFVKVPKQIEATNTGILAIADDYVKLHYTAMPRVHSTGVNNEDSYTWVKYITGSAMVELLEKGAIIKQPIELK